GHKLSGVLLSQDMPDGGMTTVYAQEGAVYRSNLDYRLVLSLKNGTQIRSDSADEQPVVLTFEKLDMPLDLTSDGDEMSERVVGRAAYSTSWKLWTFRHDPRPERVHPRVQPETHARLVPPLAVLVIPSPATPLGLPPRPRRPRMELAGFLLLILYHFVLQLA